MLCCAGSQLLMLLLLMQDGFLIVYIIQLRRAAVDSHLNKRHSLVNRLSLLNED